MPRERSARILRQWLTRIFSSFLDKSQLIQSLDQLKSTSIEGQTRQVMTNIQAILASAGSDLTRMLKCTVFLTDLQDFSAFNSVYGEYFTQTPPARTTVQAVKLPRDAKIEIDVIAYRVA